MAYSVHNNWYQSRSIRGGRRYAGDRDIQDLHSDGVLESKHSSVRGPHIAGTRQDLQNDFNRVISLMEGLITRINDNIAHQAQFAKQSQANLDQHLEQLQQKYLESKKKSDARFDAILQRISKKASKRAHHEKEGIDSEDRDEVIEQEEVEKNTTVQEIQKTKLTEKYSEEDLEECDEVLENEEELEDSCDIEVEAAADNSKTIAAGDLIPVKRANGREDLMSRARMLTIKVPSIVSLKSWKTKHKRREGVRRRNKRWNETVLHDFQGAQATSGRCGGAGWPVELLWPLRRQLKHRVKERRAARYGEGLGLILGRGFGTAGCTKRVVRDGGLQEGGNGGGVDDAAISGGDRSRSTFRARRRPILHLGTITGYLKEWAIRTRGKEVIRLPDITADVINPKWSLILLLDPLPYYNQFQNWFIHTSPSIFSLSFLIFRSPILFGTDFTTDLARLTFFPP